MAVLDVVAAGPARQARVSKVGIILEQSPFGFVHNSISNYTVLGDNHHYLQLSEPVLFDRVYFELEEFNTEPNKAVSVLLWLIQWRSSASTAQALQADLAAVLPAFKRLIAAYRAMTWDERVKYNEKPVPHAQEGEEGAGHDLVFRRNWSSVIRGPDGKERIVILEGLDQRQKIEVVLDCLQALCAWTALVLSMALSNKGPAKKSFISLLLVYGVKMLLQTIFEFDVIPAPEESDTIAVVPFVCCDMCCRDREHVDRDTDTGRVTRKTMYRLAVARVVLRMLQLPAAFGLCWSLWEEKYILRNMFIFFGLIFLLHGVLISGMGGQYIAYGPTAVGALGACFPPFVWYRLYTASRKLRAEQEEEITSMDRLFVQLKALPSAQAHLDRIQTACTQFELQGTAHVRQTTCVGRESSPSSFTLAATSAMETWEETREKSWYKWKARMSKQLSEREVRNGYVFEATRSIDQLYYQAKTLVPYLSHLVQGWAENSEGLFRVVRPRAPSAGGAGAVGQAHDAAHGAHTNRGPDDVLPVAPAGSIGYSSGANADATSATAPGADAAGAEARHVSVHAPVSHVWGASRAVLESTEPSTNGSPDASAVLPQLAHDSNVTYEKWRLLKEDRHRSEDRQRSDDGLDVECHVDFAKLKGMSRSVEKAQRCYKGDAARVCDFCRAKIAFESLEDLAKCLEQICNDPRVQVVHAKNRLNDAYDVSATQGYRDVKVNLRIIKSPISCQSDDDFQKLNVSGHICEVQLVPVVYSLVSTSVGHAKYVRYRNLRSE